MNIHALRLNVRHNSNLNIFRRFVSNGSAGSCTTCVTSGCISASIDAVFFFSSASNQTMASRVVQYSPSLPSRYIRRSSSTRSRPTPSLFIHPLAVRGTEPAQVSPVPLTIKTHRVSRWVYVASYFVVLWWSTSWCEENLCKASS